MRIVLPVVQEVVAEVEFRSHSETFSLNSLWSAGRTAH